MGSLDECLFGWLDVLVLVVVVHLLVDWLLALVDCWRFGIVVCLFDPLVVLVD